MSINDRLTPFFSVGSEHAHDKKSPDPGERQVVKAPNRNYTIPGSELSKVSVKDF